MQMSYATMLKEERERSKKFKEANFGLMTGDGFPEMVVELAGEVGQEIFFRIVLASLLGKEALKEIASLPEGVAPDWTHLVRKNMNIFELPFSLFYWGVQVGRRMEREEAQSLRILEEGK